jgi:DNA repair protein RadC
MKSKHYTIHEMELVYLPKLSVSELPETTTSKKAYELLMQLFNPNTIRCQEEFIVIYLNNSSRVLGTQKLSKGGINATIVDIRLILSTALKCLATGIIISHNHPSGNLKPSEKDLFITKNINEGCKLVDIKLLDHVIVTPDSGYFSFADEFLL